MKEGDRLRQFIENQPKSKISIARDLNISKQTLFQYFKSRELSSEVKERFEDYFGQPVFEMVSMTNTDPPGHKKEGQPSTYNERSLNNLTESNKVLAEANRTLAEANKTLAEANHVISKNHDELIQLTKMIVANSTATQSLKPLPADQHTQYEDDDRPAEDFLNPKGKSPSQKGYKAGSGHARGR